MQPQLPPVKLWVVPEGPGPRDPACCQITLHGAPRAPGMLLDGRTDRWNPALLLLSICMTEWQIHEIHNQSSAFPSHPNAGQLS